MCIDAHSCMLRKPSTFKKKIKYFLKIVLGFSLLKDSPGKRMKINKDEETGKHRNRLLLRGCKEVSFFLRDSRFMRKVKLGNLEAAL